MLLTARCVYLETYFHARRRGGKDTNNSHAKNNEQVQKQKQLRKKKTSELYKKVTKNKHSQIKTLLHMFSDPPPLLMLLLLLLLLLILILISRHSVPARHCCRPCFVHPVHTNCVCGNTVCQLTVHLSSKYVRELTKFAPLSHLQNRFKFVQCFLSFNHYIHNITQYSDLILSWTIYFLISYHSQYCKA